MIDRHSPEVEAVARRALIAYMWDHEALANLVTTDPGLRVLGSDEGEIWRGHEQFLTVRGTQVRESGLTNEDRANFRVDEIEAFQDGEFGWANLSWTLVTPEAETHIRSTALFCLEAGLWRIVQWHNSIPVPNQRVYGVDLTITLDDLVQSVLDEGADVAPGAVTEGTMTLVFTDIVDSTELASSVGDAEWADMIAAHQSTISHAAADHDGAVVKFLGDGSMLSFQSARGAVRAALDIKKQTDQEPYAVRIGAHSGEVMSTGTDLLGLTVHKAARIAAAADGGEVMISTTTRDLVGTLEGTKTGEPRTVLLKGIDGTHQLVPIS